MITPPLTSNTPINRRMVAKTMNAARTKYTYKKFANATPLVTISIFAFCLVTIIADVFIFFRPLYNAIPMFIIVECWIKSKVEFNKYFILLLLLWAFWCSLALITSGQFNSEFIFVIMSIATVSIAFRTRQSAIQILLAAQVMALILLATTRGGFDINFASQYSYRATQSDTESSIGLASALIFLTAYSRKWPKTMAIAFIVTLLFGKRIALVGIIVALTADSAKYFLPLPIITRYRVVTIIAYCAIAAAIGVFASTFYTWIADYLNQYWRANVSPNYLSSGRYSGISSFTNFMIPRNNIIHTIIGHGTGFTDSMLSKAVSLRQSVTYKLLHDDWLRMLTDYGLIGTILMVIFLSVLAKKSRLGFLIAMYTATIFTSDNAMTYTFYWITLAICLNLSPREINKLDNRKFL
ncbi:hypothetical protein [Novosphingobium mangrovi (ex Huang et al. 2023)]|uniref:O-antigen ligase domain-containing protein n=1 Tax=Novosphingobium mangrovi (ex Huang et al. 2023) TaxID=2976432 RepID=A0ABT2HZU2_9SPHN|nr:hypothetical protein [Novosphingobium mangrovi (ex Huang et al. 2023)]MCT2398069.1 hypothetical protein [Novosphingobium mangrovi (ex Huang et al. 2023)]